MFVNHFFFNLLYQINVVMKMKEIYLLLLYFCFYFDVNASKWAGYLLPFTIY